MGHETSKSGRTLSIQKCRSLPLTRPVFLILFRHHPLTSTTSLNKDEDKMLIPNAIAALASLVGLSQAFEISFPNSNGGYWVVRQRQAGADYLRIQCIQGSGMQGRLLTRQRLLVMAFAHSAIAHRLTTPTR